MTSKRMIALATRVLGETPGAYCRDGESDPHRTGECPEWCSACRLRAALFEAEMDGVRRAIDAIGDAGGAISAKERLVEVLMGLEKAAKR